MSKFIENENTNFWIRSESKSRIEKTRKKNEKKVDAIYACCIFRLFSYANVYIFFRTFLFEENNGDDNNDEKRSKKAWREINDVREFTDLSFELAK